MSKISSQHRMCKCPLIRQWTVALLSTGHQQPAKRLYAKFANYSVPITVLQKGLDRMKQLNSCSVGKAPNLSVSECP